MFRKEVPNTLLQMLLRGANAVGYTSYPENVVRHFIAQAAKNGVDVFRVFDCLNSVETMSAAIDEVRNQGKLAEITLCYTGDILDSSRPKYNLDYYVKMAKDLQKVGANTIAIKDMSGILKPQAAYNLVSALKDAVDLPIHLHTHEGSGNAIYTYGRAIDAGVDIVDVAYSAFSNGTSQPSMNSLYYALEGHERQPELNTDYMQAMSDYFGSIRPYYKGIDKGISYPNTTVYTHEMPGGQYSNLEQQAKSLGLGDRWNEIQKVYHQVNMMFGDIIKVTPSSKVVGDMTLFMVQNDLTQEDIMTRGRELDYPQSVVEFFQGRLGIPYQGFPVALQDIILKGDKSWQEQAKAALAPVDFAAKKAELEEMKAPTTEEDLSAYCLYPKVYADWQAFVQEFGDVSILDTPTFFFGMKAGEEINVALEKGKNLIIKLVLVSDPDEEGNRLVRFELNGQARTIKVHDKQVKTTGLVRRKANKANPNEIGATLSGSLVKVAVSLGQKVKKGDVLLVTEAMKMETTITAPKDGTVAEILVTPGSRIESGDCLLVLQ